MRSVFHVGFVLVSTMAGCTTNEDFTWVGCPVEPPKVYGWTCCELDPKYWDKPEKYAAHCPDAGVPDAGGDSGDLDGSAGGSSAISCTGDCVPVVPDGWTGPSLFWFGPPADAPPCPGSAPALSQSGWLDLTVSDECPPCVCDPPDGTCEPPATFTVHSELCYQPGSEDTPYDPPAGWAGTCTTENPIPPGKDCPDGSGIPCVRSITFSALRVHDACTVHQGPVPTPTPPVPTWSAFGVMCKLSPDIEMSLGTCGDGKLQCVPKANQPLPPDFRHCIFTFGDRSCDGLTYTERYVMYEGFNDDRSCSDCACNPPEGGICEGVAAVYEDSTCSTLAEAKKIDSTMSYCADLMEGIALGSKDVTGLKYFPGTCQPTGGELTGTIDLVEPKTVCCLPSQPPVP